MNITAVERLNELRPEHMDSSVARDEAITILLNFIEEQGFGEVAAAWRDAEMRFGQIWADN